MDILKYEKSFKEKGYTNIVGIDEAGRGPLAGPVVAVSVNWGVSPIIEGVKDSKKITEKKRLKLFYEMLWMVLKLLIINYLLKLLITR